MAEQLTRLTEALAAAERRSVFNAGKCGEEYTRAEAAEARVRELEAELSKMQSAPAAMLERAIAAESRLAAANALLERCQKAVSPVSLLGRDLDAHLAAQPATAPASDRCSGCGVPVPENGAHTCQPAAPARGDVLSDGTWIRTPEEERAATAPARDEPPMTPPYAVLADGSIVPLMNCPECNEMGRADMAHYHVCKRVCTEAEQAVLDAIGKAFIYQDTRGAAVFAIPSEEGDICRAELARRGLKT